MPSRKLMLAVGIATVGVTLIGLGVRASFTTSVNVTQTISTGNVNALITDVTWSTFDGEGYTAPIEVGGAPFANGVSSVNIGTSSNNGSSIDEIFSVTVKNFGSLDMNLNCQITAGASDSAAMGNELIVWDPKFGDGGEFGNLSEVEGGTNVCGFGNPDIPAGQTIVQQIRIEGTLASDAMGSSISPTLTISGNDINSGFGNTPTP